MLNSDWFGLSKELKIFKKMAQRAHLSPIRPKTQITIQENKTHQKT